MNYKILGATALVAIVVGYLIGSQFSYREVTKTKVKQIVKTKRQIVRITNPDGSIREEINEEIKENKKSNLVRKIAPRSKWYVRASTGLTVPNTYEVGVGREILPNLSLEISYNTSDKALYGGLLLRF